MLATDERGVFDISGIKDTRTFLIAALPASLGYDGSATACSIRRRGFRLSGRISPELSARKGAFTYGRAQLDASAYRPVSDRVVAAGRVRLGTIIGAGAFDLAPSRRFYSGGGGSVRGYGYQQLGPKDMDGDPIGGRGLAEFAVEARIRLKSVRRQLRDRAVLRRRVADHRTLRRASPTGASPRALASAIIRASARSGSTSACRLNRQKGDGPVAVTVSLGQAF